MPLADTLDPTQYNLAWTGTIVATGLALMFYGGWTFYRSFARPHLIGSAGIYINLFILAIPFSSPAKTARKKIVLQILHIVDSDLRLRRPSRSDKYFASAAPAGVATAISVKVTEVQMLAYGQTRRGLVMHSTRLAVSKAQPYGRIY
ncbi:hypothetical protein GGX14DRAFT_398624 [Mycena pura]|uniref:Uncharacterized protein n=1 Tax=Mycena pura TaxID=153505 RepID=A0AAD6Y7P5_9AGAR|nr:hypothetical protein GGX14DRAFT_398624 [Mycena pura]